MKMIELEKTISFSRGMGLAVCMLIGTGILALPGLALDAGTVHEAILGWFLIAIAAVPLIAICSRLLFRASCGCPYRQRVYGAAFPAIRGRNCAFCGPACNPDVSFQPGGNEGYFHDQLCSSGCASPAYQPANSL